MKQLWFKTEVGQLINLSRAHCIRIGADSMVRAYFPDDGDACNKEFGCTHILGAFRNNREAQAFIDDLAEKLKW